MGAQQPCEGGNKRWFWRSRLAWRDSVLSAPAQDSSRSGQSSSPRACSGGSAARQWHARTHSVGAAFVLHTVSQQELARRTRCEATGEAGRSPAGSSRLQTASTTSARALFRVFARVRCCFGTRLQNSREKRPSFFTALVPVRASPVPVLREIFINQQEITTLTVIWARQIVSPQPKFFLP